MSGDTTEEIKYLEERFRKAPESRLFAPLADACRKAGDLDRAIELCEQGIGKHPDYASAHVILGKCYYDKGATERSKGEFNRVLELDPENMVALKFLGDIFLGEDDPEKASVFYKKLIAIDPTNEAVLKSLKDIKGSFKVREIDLEDRKTVKSLEHPGELATMTLAGIYASQGYYAKALGMYREILENEPGNSEASEMVAKLESMIVSSEDQRSEAFGDEVLSISLDEVTSELAENTAGHGSPGEGSHQPAGVMGEEVGSGEGREEEEAVVEEPEESGEPGDEAGEPEPAGDMTHFQDWLRQIQKKKDEDD